MLEKVPLLNQDQQSKEQRFAITIPIHRIYNWWKNRNKEEKEDGIDSGECVISAGSFAPIDQIDQRIDEAIARANGTRNRGREESNCA